MGAQKTPHKGQHKEPHGTVPLISDAIIINVSRKIEEGRLGTDLTV